MAAPTARRDAKRKRGAPSAEETRPYRGCNQAKARSASDATAPE
jgi:hypothetical protein